MTTYYTVKFKGTPALIGATEEVVRHFLTSVLDASQAEIHAEGHPSETIDGTQWLLDNPAPTLRFRFEGRFETLLHSEHQALGDEANSYYDDRAATVDRWIDGAWCPADADRNGWKLPDGTIQPFEP